MREKLKNLNTNIEHLVLDLKIQKIQSYEDPTSDKQGPILFSLLSNTRVQDIANMDISILV